MNKIKKRKGFTLIELVVVIAIIATLAAIIVPTTMHYTELAHESNDKLLIDISNNITGYINMSGNSEDLILITEDIDTNVFVKLFENDPGIAESKKYISKITFVIINNNDNSCNIMLEIIGRKEAKNDQVINKTIAENINKDVILKNTLIEDIPDKIIFNIKEGKVLDIEIIENI